MSLRWTPLARSDLLSIFDYVSTRNPPAADHLVSAIDDQLEALLDFPQMGRPGRVAGTREFVISRTPYIVAYRLRGQDIEILRVLHGARRWPESL